MVPNAVSNRALKEKMVPGFKRIIESTTGIITFQPPFLHTFVSKYAVIEQVHNTCKSAPFKQPTKKFPV
jgi:hypothetical protein